VDLSEQDRGDQGETLKSVRDADSNDLRKHYFQPLGKHRRAERVVNLARVYLSLRGSRLDTKRMRSSGKLYEFHRHCNEQ